MKFVGRFALAAAALVFAAGIANAHPVKVGVVMTFSGGAAQFGNQIEKGYMLYHNQNKDSLKHPIIFIKRDSKNPGGQVAARMVQELITRENVDILTGFDDRTADSTCPGEKILQLFAVAPTNSTLQRS